MHPLIAFLAFIFSPTENWTLKQAFELFVDPAQVPAVAEQVARTAKKYPTVAKIGDKEVSADAVNAALWSTILERRGHVKEAHAAWKRAAIDPRAPAELTAQMKLQLGEAAMADGQLEEAKKHFEEILSTVDDPHQMDARIDLLVIALRQEDEKWVKIRAADIEARLGGEAPVKRAVYPLGLAAYSAGNFETAKKHFEKMDQDPRGLYFLGLTLRKLDRPREALMAWQSLRGAGRDPYWTRLADAQAAETYFALGDDRLSRAAGEKTLAQLPENHPLSDTMNFRLASIEMRSGDYDAALARLEPLDDPNLADRANTLTAEALTQAGRPNELFKRLSREKMTGAEKAYQTAWAALHNKKYATSLGIAETGLERYYDRNYTPRLLLLQGLSFEHTDHEAEALATYQTVIDRFPATEAAAQSVHWMTLAYMRLGRAREAVTHGGHAWGELPDDLQRAHPETAYWLAEAHLKLDRVDDADLHFSKFLASAEPKHKLVMNAQFQRSVTLAKMNRPGEALAMLDQFSKTATDRGQAEWAAYANLQKGNIYMNNKQYAEAATSYASAGGASKALYNAALALYRLEYYTDASQRWARVGSERHAEKWGEMAAFRSARTQFELGRATEAVNGFILFAQAYPQSDLVKPARLQAAHALYNAGKAADAAPYYADYLKRYPTTEDMAAITPYLAECYARMGKLPLEADELMKGLPPTDAYAAIRWERGAKDFNEKDWRQAELMFAQLATDAPAHENASAARFYRGESAFTQGKWNDAEASFGSYLASTDPADLESFAPVALFHKGVSLYNQDKLLKAAGAFEKMVVEYPSHPLVADAGQNLLLCYNNLGIWSTRDRLREKYRIPFQETLSTVATDSPKRERAIHEITPGTAPLAITPEDVASHPHHPEIITE